MTANQIVVAALGLPVSKDGKKVLLTQRHAPGHPLEHDKWQIAGGGLNFGETIEEAVTREIYEELHVSCKIIYPHPIVKTSVWKAETQDEGDTEVVLITYLIDIGDQTPDLSQDPDWETSAYAWFTHEEAQNLDFLPLTLPIVEEVFALIDQRAILKPSK
jgi:8-oxo-dGTP pyrophosphatase MutT (NUDIX family)